VFSEAHFTVNFWSDKPFDLEELTNAKEISIKVRDTLYSFSKHISVFDLKPFLLQIFELLFVYFRYFRAIRITMFVGRMERKNSGRLFE
jgi:hypothetical protein